MRIGEHEVVVVSKDTVKVGCQTVSREQVKQVLAEMDGWQEGILVKDLPIGEPALAICGNYMGSVFIRAATEAIRLYRGGSSWDKIDFYGYSTTRCRLLKEGEAVQITKEGTCELVNMKS